MSGQLYQCSSCFLIFSRSISVEQYGELVECCPRPECLAPDIDWDLMPTYDLMREFHAIIGLSYKENERVLLREYSENYMGPFNPLSREL